MSLFGTLTGLFGKGKGGGKGGKSTAAGEAPIFGRPAYRGTGGDPRFGQDQQPGNWRAEQVSLEEADLFLNGHITLMVQSSNVESVKYYPDAEKMEVAFLAKKGGSGGRYLYSGVTLAEAQAFLAAGSKGRWVWDYLRVRNSKTAHQKSYVKVG